MIDCQTWMLGLKWVWNTYYQTVDPIKIEPQVGRGLFGVSLLILNFKFQFSKAIKSSTFHIFLNLTYLLRKNISFPTCPKITQKFTQNRKTLGNVPNGGIWRCLKRERDISTKAMLSDVKTAFRWNSTLINLRFSWYMRWSSSETIPY